jgi:hypothetical protein
MVRKIATVVALAVAAFFLAVGIASASDAAPGTTDYVPPPVTSTLSTPTPTTTQVLSTSSSLIPPTSTVRPTTSKVVHTTAPSTVATSTSTAVLATSQTTTKVLSYTGSGINVGLSITVGAIILLAGISLTVVGTRMSRRRSPNHS